MVAISRLGDRISRDRPPGPVRRQATSPVTTMKPGLGVATAAVTVKQAPGGTAGTPTTVAPPPPKPKTKTSPTASLNPSVVTAKGTTSLPTFLATSLTDTAGTFAASVLTTETAGATRTLPLEPALPLLVDTATPTDASPTTPTTPTPHRTEGFAWGQSTTRPGVVAAATVGSVLGAAVIALLCVWYARRTAWCFVRGGEEARTPEERWDPSERRPGSAIPHQRAVSRGSRRDWGDSDSDPEPHGGEGLPAGEGKGARMPHTYLNVPRHLHVSPSPPGTPRPPSPEPIWSRTRSDDLPTLESRMDDRTGLPHTLDVQRDRHVSSSPPSTPQTQVAALPKTDDDDGPTGVSHTNFKAPRHQHVSLSPPHTPETDATYVTGRSDPWAIRTPTPRSARTTLGSTASTSPAAASDDPTIVPDRLEGRNHAATPTPRGGSPTPEAPRATYTTTTQRLGSRRVSLSDKASEMGVTGVPGVDGAGLPDIESDK